MSLPEPGFYYHYKRNPADPVNETAYELIGIGWDTESAPSHSENPEDFIEFVLYRPLFESALTYKNGKKFWVRPAHMWLEEVEKDGKKSPRFQKITDPEIISKLEQIRDEMY